MSVKIKCLVEFTEGQDNRYFCHLCNAELVVKPSVPKYCPECRGTLDTGKLVKYNPNAKRANK